MKWNAFGLNQYHLKHRPTAKLYINLIIKSITINGKRLPISRFILKILTFTIQIEPLIIFPLEARIEK